MDLSGLPRVLPRQAPEGVMPLAAFEGEAYDCGREYAEFTLKNFPGYREYLDHAAGFQKMAPEALKLLEQRAPQIIDVFHGILDVAGPPQQKPSPEPKSACTGFSLLTPATLDGGVITGQTKDTPLNRIPRYLVLRMRLKGAPTILVIAYPGEVFGYGMWSTGICHTRHGMYAQGGGTRKGLGGGALGWLCCACSSVDEIVELHKKYAGGGPGGAMWCDAKGNAVAVDVTKSAVGFRFPMEGILTRSNHPEAAECACDESYPLPSDGEDSKYRTRGLYDLFYKERGRLTAQKAYQIISDHTMYPRGPCKHFNENGDVTTCLYIAEPQRGLFHAVRGHPCENWPVTYAL
jgi:hypothetical protein